MARMWRCFGHSSTVCRRQKRAISYESLKIDLKCDENDFENRPPPHELIFGTTLSDHMLTVEYVDKQWQSPIISPRKDLSLSPAASCLHYGLQCFEGMKAYKSLTDDSTRLFRPDMNMKRLASSMERLEMPGAEFDHDELLSCIKKLVEIDEKWIPSGEGYSLYIRPTVIATQRFLGLSPPDSLLFFCVTSPVGPYYKSGFKPVRLTADSSFVRAWPGGTGAQKVGGNYAATMKPQAQAAAQGYSQVLWLYGEDETITEVGSMNVFFLLINPETQRRELVTPPLTRGDILPGVTRDSILQLVGKWGDVDVVERFPTMPEIVTASREDRLLEAFGAGTAAVVTPIEAIQYKGQDVEIPATGDLTQRVWDEITAIQYGKAEGPAGWSIDVRK